MAQGPQKRAAEAARRQGCQGAPRDLRAHVFGDAAVVSMVAESQGTYKGKPFSENSRGIDFFAKRDGRWQVVNSQMTTIKP
jgi:ketosteroid isomerase-like protein